MRYAVPEGGGQANQRAPCADRSAGQDRFVLCAQRI